MEIDPPIDVTTTDVLDRDDITTPSAYNYDIVITYKMIDDIDDQDTLFRIQFLQAFGISDDTYNPDIVSVIIDDLYEQYNDNKDIRDILRGHPLYHANGEEDIGNNNSEMIFCMMFSFQIFDLFHKCLQLAHDDQDIPQTLKDEIATLHKEMF